MIPVTFPAGRYLIGDLCYRDEYMWDAMLNTPMGKKGKVENSYEGTVHDFCILRTKWGDGGYDDQYGNEYFVDSGTIGIMSWNQDKKDSGTGRTFNFAGPFQVYEENGKLVFGSIIINTDPVYEEKEEYELEETF